MVDIRRDSEVSLEDLTPEEANRIIHSHRKVRYGTACWPCRQRKVKCDNQQPCENCVKREHPQLCSYKPNRASTSKTNNSTTVVKDNSAAVTTNGTSNGAGAAANGATNGNTSGTASSTASTSTSTTAASTTSNATTASTAPTILTAPITNDNITNGRKRAHSPDAQTEPTLPPAQRQGSWPRTITSVEETEEAPESATRYLGSNSIPALLKEQSSASDLHSGGDIRQNMRSILGLDTSAPFPLMSSKHLDSLTREISSELPSDREVMKLFRTYKETPQQFWGFVVDIDDLESKLMTYLEDRARNARSSTRKTKPVSASWLAILFAVLAVGSQYHDSPYHIRTRDSQKYIQISFHFLRLGNFLMRPTFDSIQAMLLTSFALLNDMKAEASWALLGLTCRLAQSLGLHKNAPPLDEKEAARPEVRCKEQIRRKLWWTCVWHDTLTSLSFDRAPMTDFPSCPIPTTPRTAAGDYTYVEAMYHLIEIISRRLNPDTMGSVTYEQMIDNCGAVEALRSMLSPSIRYKEQCKSVIDRLQHFAIRLHTSFVISVCCRPALHRETPLTAEQKKTLVDKCQKNLTETVRMFLAMHQLSVIPTRSWAFTYHGLSSALLLGILTETKTRPDVRNLQGDLIAALSATAAKDANSPTDIPRTDKDIELSGPLERALNALKNIYEHGSVVGNPIKTEPNSAFPSRARTPLLTHATPLPTGGVNGSGLQSRAMLQVDGHDANLTLSELHQNGTPLDASEFTNGLTPAALPGPSDTLGDTSGVSMDGLTSTLDPATYMSPLDLYDSIWWESPDPWNSGLDTMNFDFVAQPPPGQPQQYYF